MFAASSICAGAVEACACRSTVSTFDKGVSLSQRLDDIVLSSDKARLVNLFGGGITIFRSCVWWTHTYFAEKLLNSQRGELTCHMHIFTE